MIKEGEGGMKKALQYLLSVSAVSNSHDPIEKDFHNVVPGDHLVYKTTIGWEINYYVLANLEKGCIKVVGTFLEGNDDPFVEEKLIFDADKAKQLKIMEGTLCESQCKNFLKRRYKGISNVSEEKDRLQTFKSLNKPYSFLYNNSEHFVTYVKEGEAKCEMCKDIEIVFKKYMFVKAAQNGSLKSAKSLFDGSSSWGILVGAITGRFVGTATKQAAIATAKEVGKAATKQAATTTAKEVVKEVGKTATKQATATTAKEVGKAATKQAATTTAKEVGKAATKQAATTTAEEVGKTATKQAATTTAKEVGKTATKQAATTTAKEVGKATTKQAATTTAKEVGKTATKQAATTTAKEVGKAATKQAATTTAKEVGKTATKQAATTTAKEVGKAATKQAATTTAKEVGKTATKQAATTTAKEVGKAATKQAATTTAKEVGKTATKQAATTTAKEVGKTATKQAATTTAKEVGKTATKQAATTTAKEVGKAATKQAAATTAKEVGKAATKQAAATTAKEVGKAATKQAAATTAKEVGKAATKRAAATTAKEVGKAATKQAATTTAKEVGKTATKQAATTTAKEVGKAATKQAAATTAKEVGKAATKQAATTTAKEVGKTATKQAATTTTKEVGKAATKQAATTTAKEAAKEVSKTATKQAATTATKQVAANAVRQSLRVSIVSGLLIEGALYTAQMGRAVYKRKNGQMDPEEFKDFTVEQTATSGGSAAGGISGSLAGVAAGAAVGSVVPVIGTAIGAFAGGLLGGVAGGVGGGLLGKQVGGLINSHRENNKWQLDCNTPNDIAVSPNNELIILDSCLPKALVVSAELVVVKELSFSGNGAIAKPSGIAVSGTTMAVGDRSNHVVKILSFEAKYLSMVKFTTKSKGGDFPFRIQFNSKGVLYVLDLCNSRVQAFDTKKNNAFCGIVGSQGSDPGQYQHPVCIAVDGSDNVYVTDCCSKCINMYSRDGHAFLYKIDCLCKPCAITFSPDNHLIVGDHENNCIRVFGLPYKNSFFKGLFGNGEKEHSRKLTNIFGTVGGEKEEFNEISGIVVNSDGTICVVESKNGRLQLIGTSIWRRTLNENDIKKYEERFKLSDDKSNG